MTTGWPIWAETCSKTMRGTMSVVVPAPNGTMTWSGLAGQLPAPAVVTVRATTRVVTAQWFHGITRWFPLAAANGAQPEASRLIRPIYNWSGIPCRDGIGLMDGHQ